MCAAAVTLLSACASPTPEGAATGDPIVVASVNSLSGPAAYPEASQAAQAVFDEFNANGGLDGRPIEYVVLDDKGDPTAAGTAARDAVSTHEAVALVGSASILDCEVNHPVYEEHGIVSIQGTGVDPYCFSTPNISPVNLGPFMGAELTLMHATQQLGLTSICGYFSNATGSWKAAYDAAIERWTAATGAQFTLTDFSIPYSQPDFTPQVVQAKEAGCDAIFFATIEPDALSMLKAANSQGMTDMTFLFLTSVYSSQFAEAAEFVGKGAYALAEFSPYSDSSVPGNEEWIALMEKHGVPLTSFAQGGYLAATHFLEGLQSIEGEVTRESVTQLFTGMADGYASTMTGTEWMFGSGDAHSSNRAGWPIQIAPGASAWTSAADDWILATD